MKLKTVYFDALKAYQIKNSKLHTIVWALLEQTNSGKSNILTAINVLSGNRKLASTDAPKMLKDCNPSLRFLFKLDDKRNQRFLCSNYRMAKNNTIIKTLNASDIKYFITSAMIKRKMLKAGTFLLRV